MVVLVQMDTSIKVHGATILQCQWCYLGHSGGVELDGPGATQNHFTGEGAAHLQTFSYQSPFKLIFCARFVMHILYIMS